MDRYASYAPLILRLGLGFVFLWFGYSGMTETAMWTGLVPDWATAIAPAATLIQAHAIVEIIGGLLLIFGIQVRIVAFILLLNLIHTITLLPYGPIMVRDIGLAAALLSLVAGGGTAKS